MKKKWIALPLLALLIVLSWVAAGPFMTINAIRNAIQAQDSDALSRRIDFPRLRQSLQAQAEDALARRIGNSPLSGLANQAVAGMVGAAVTPIGLGAILEGRGLLHHIGSSDNGEPDHAVLTGKDKAYAHQPLPDPLHDVRYRFESPSRFTATAHTTDGAAIVFILLRQGLSWKLTDIRLPAMQAEQTG